MNIQAIKEFYKRTKNHKKTESTFNLTASQEYAINILGQDYNLSDDLLNQHIEQIKNLKTIDEIATIFNIELKF